jgi:hypothetical protein
VLRYCGLQRYLKVDCWEDCNEKYGVLELWQKFILRMDVEAFLETFVNIYLTTQRDIPKDSTIHSRRHNNVKCDTSAHLSAVSVS